MQQKKLLLKELSMWTNDIIYNFFFEITLFFLLIWLIYMLFSRIIKPILYTMMEHEKQQVLDLVKKQYLIKETRKTLQIKTAQEKKQIREIKKKIQDSYSIKLKRLDEQKKQHALILEKITQKRTLQQNFLHLENLKYKVIPIALKNAHEEIDALFETKGKTIFLELVDELEKQSNLMPNADGVTSAN